MKLNKGNEENKSIKQERNKKYLIIGIILLVIMGVLWIIGNVDLSKDKEVRVSENKEILNSQESNNNYAILILIASIIIACWILAILFNLGLKNRGEVL